MLTPDQLLQKGRYRIINPLGQNGIGMGYEAFDHDLESNVLLKEIHDNLNKVTTPAQLEQRQLTFANEAKALIELKHESLLQIHHYFSEIDRHYLVTENIDGNHLGELLEKKKAPLPLASVAAWADQLLDAVNYLHQQRPPLFHRDIKPQNIKLTATGKIKLLTFSLTQAAEAKARTTFATPSFDPSALPYSPLEQIWEGLDTASKKVILNSYDDESEKILEEPADARSDVYSAGATFYHLMTGRLPADALTRSIDILEGKIDPLPTPFELNPSIPPEVSDVIMTALEIRREHRFSSAAMMRQVLRTAFVRVKEREANTALKNEEMLEIPAELKPAPRQPVKVENLPIEDDQKWQLDLIRQQLREAEAKRLEAERRAAEAEKRLLEKEAKMLKVKDMVILQPKENQVQKDIPAQENSPAPPETAAAPAVRTEPESGTVKEEPQAENENFAPRRETISGSESNDEFDGLFAQPEKDNSFVKKMSAVAGLLIVLGGAAFAVWTFVLAKPSASRPAETPVAASSPATPAPTATAPVLSAETENLPPRETAPAIDAVQQTPVTESSAPAATAKVRPGVPAQPVATPVKKQNIATTKAPSNEKKSVTLDDLLKDN